MLQNTKESRRKSRDYQFTKLIESGYIRETYKEIDFFTINNGKYFTLKVYRGTGANHVEHVNYRTEERRAEVIQNYKSNYDSRQDYKAEQKIKNKGKLSSHAAAAAAIKAELSTLYPHIKFSVKSESFSMGDSVDIRWDDGPTTEEVEQISSKYQYGHFDGMTDMYESTNLRDDIPQSKYVHTSRNISEELQAILLPDAEKYFSADHYSNVRDKHDFLRRIFSNSSIPTGATVTGIESTGVTCGLSSPEVFYRIAYTLPESATNNTTPQIKEIEAKAGEINIIEYGKGIAVIGDTKPIKDKLKALGGCFNFRLTCGPGWVFPKSKLAEITEALTAKPDTLQTEIEKTVAFFEETDKKIYGEVQEDTKVIKMLQSPVKQYETIEDITEAANKGECISLLNFCKIVSHV